MATTLSVDVPDETATALDQAAAAQHRDRNDLLKDALLQYLSVDQYQREEIEAGLRDLEEGRVVDHETVVARFEQWKAELHRTS